MRYDYLIRVFRGMPVVQSVELCLAGVAVIVGLVVVGLAIFESAYRAGVLAETERARSISKRVAVLLVAFGLMSTTGCGDWKSEPESNAETHRKFNEAIRQADVYKMQYSQLENKARKALAKDDQDAFEAAMDELRDNLNQRAYWYVEAEHATSDSLLKSIAHKEYEKTQVKIKEFSTIARSLREGRERELWLKHAAID
jgi:hypothetical protein